MKKMIFKLLPILIIGGIAASLLIFYGVTLNRDDGLNISEPNLAETATIGGSGGSNAAFDNSKMTSWTVTEKGSETIVDFGHETELNMLLLNEVGFNVKQFSIYTESGGDWALSYRQNEIGINRLATFYPVKTNRIKFVIDDFKNAVLISDIKIYNLAPRAREKKLRVTAYVTPDSLDVIDPDCFDVITDVQFIAYGRFDASGNVDDGVYEKDGSAKRKDEELKVLKEMIGDRDVNIFLTIFPPISTDNSVTMASVYRNHMDRAVTSVVECVLATETDGADFDWEYPANKEEYDLYSTFIVRLKRELLKYGKQISVALSPWNVQLSKEAVEAIDQMQIMTYDLFDHNGDNNSYAGSVDNAVRFMLDRGFELEQLNLGISYYGRPSDGSNKWYDYKDPRFTPDEYIMFQNGVWFNTPTTVRDKTVYSILRGLGGIMTFSQNEDLNMDHPLSLTAEIGRARAAFSREA